MSSLIMITFIRVDQQLSKYKKAFHLFLNLKMGCFLNYYVITVHKYKIDKYLI